MRRGVGCRLLKPLRGGEAPPPPLRAGAREEEAAAARSRPRGRVAPLGPRSCGPHRDGRKPRAGRRGRPGTPPTGELLADFWGSRDRQTRAAPSGGLGPARSTGSPEGGRGSSGESRLVGRGPGALPPVGHPGGLILQVEFNLLSGCLCSSRGETVGLQGLWVLRERNRAERESHGPVQQEA